MHSLRLLSIASIISMALLPMALCALPVPTATPLPTALSAQDQQKTTVAANPETPSATAEAPQEEVKAEPTHLFRFNLGLSDASLNVNGNDKRFRQYVTPSSDTYLSPFTFYYQPSNGRVLADVNLHDIAQPSVGGTAWFSLGAGSVVFNGQQRQSEFYRDWTADSELLTQRDGSYQLGIRTPSGKTFFGPGELLMSYDNVSLSGAYRTDPESWKLHTSTVRYTDYLSNWRASLGNSEEQFKFAAGSSFSGTTSTTQFQLSPPTSDSTSLEANASVSHTTLNGIATTPTGYNVGLEGAQILAPYLSLTGNLTHNEIKDTITQNAYANRETNGDVTAEFSGIPRTLIDVGVGDRHVGYVNTPQTADIAADVQTLYAKATTRLLKQLKIKGSAAYWWTDGRPASVDIAGTEAGSLVWSSKNDQRLELSYSPMWTCGITGQWRHLGWKNNDFGTDNSLIEQSVYAWWMPYNRLTLYANYLRQNAGLNGLVTVPGEQGYVSNDETTQYGFNYLLRKALTLDINYTRGTTWGAEGTNQNIWSFGLNYALHSGDSLSLRAVLNGFDTSVDAPTDDYQGNWFEVRFTKALF